MKLLLKERFNHDNIPDSSIYTDWNIFPYLNDNSIKTPLWIDTAKICFYLDVLKVIEKLNLKNITSEDVFFYSQLNDEDLCPHDVCKLQEYRNENLGNIRKNIIMSIIEYIRAIANEFNLTNKVYSDLGLSIPLIKEVRDKLVELCKCTMKFSRNDLYLKLTTLRNSIKLASKRYNHIETTDVIGKNIEPFGCVLNMTEIADLLKYVCFLDNKKYNFDNEDDLKEVVYLSDKDHLKISVLALECLLMLIDQTKTNSENKLYYKLSNFYEGYAGHKEVGTLFDISNAYKWISTLPSLEPNNVIQVHKVKKFKNIKNVVNRGDVFNKKMPTYKYLVNIYQALAN